jgi:hypothetical protein
MRENAEGEVNQPASLVGACAPCSGVDRLDGRLRLLATEAAFRQVIRQDE